jgi:ADP-heptose:LPS heptosyltransferase
LNSSLADPSDRLPSRGIHRILVCRPNHRLGNMLLMTPLIAELERQYKGAEIDVVAEGPLAADVFATYFSVRHVYCLARRGFKHPVSFLSTIFRIRRNYYDLIIDPCIGSGFSRTLTRLFRGRYKLGFGDRQTAKALTHSVPECAAPPHMAQRPVALLRWQSTSAASQGEPFPAMDIRLTEAERASGEEAVRELLAEQPPQQTRCRVGIFADATGRKVYPAAWWEAFLSAVRERAPHCALVEIVPMHGRSMLGSRWPSYYSSSIRRMGAVMAAMDLIISADCGVMHLAAASKVPTIGLFCATDARVYGPYGQQNGSLVTPDLSPQEAAGRVMAAFPDLFDVPHPPQQLPAAPVQLADRRQSALGS